MYSEIHWHARQEPRPVDGTVVCSHSPFSGRHNPCMSVNTLPSVFDQILHPAMFDTQMQYFQETTEYKPFMLQAVERYFMFESVQTWAN